MIKLLTKQASKILLSALFFLSVSSCKTETLQAVLNEGVGLLEGGGKSLKPSRAEIGKGLKEALSVSIEKGARSLALKDGFFKNKSVKIFLPKEILKIQKTLKKIGMGRLSDELTLKLNRAAEDAAVKSIPIFKKAIVSMSFSDVMSVLTGSSHAATSYLQKSTSKEILRAFSPQVENSLEKVGAASLWKKIFSRYNQIPFVDKVNADLVGYTSEKALYGLFKSVSVREKEIRKSFKFRPTPLIKKVFSYAETLNK